MKFSFALLILSFALIGCGNDDTAAPSNKATSDDRQPEPAGLTGTWQSDQRLLVLEKDGSLYLPSDRSRQGLDWAREDSAITLTYMNSDALTVDKSTLQAKQDKNSLALQGDGSLAGNYQRHNGALDHISGNLTLPDDAELPDQAVAAITLNSDGDNNGQTLVARRLIPLKPNSLDDNKLAFRLYFPADTLAEGATHRVASQILAEGGQFFRAPPLALSRDDQGGFDDITLAWQPVMQRSQSLRGRLSVHSQRATFTQCNTDKRLQIAGPQRASLLKAYKDSADHPGQPLVVSLTGLPRKQPGQIPGSTEAALVVESFQLEPDSDACPLPAAALTNTLWRLHSLGGKPITVAEHQRPPQLTLGDDNNVKGHAGCNGVTGQYQQEGNRLRFAKLASTEKACPGLDQEQQVLSALQQARGYRIQGNWLSLTGPEGQVLASFQATYL